MKISELINYLTEIKNEKECGDLDIKIALDEEHIDELTKDDIFVDEFISELYDDDGIILNEHGEPMRHVLCIDVFR